MVNRARAESWTSGLNISAFSLQKRLHLSASDSKLCLSIHKKRKERGITSSFGNINDEINYAPRREKMNMSCSCNDSDLCYMRPVFCSKSMESVDLDEKLASSDKNVASESSSLQAYSINSSERSTSANTIDRYENNAEPNSFTHCEGPEKLTFHSFFKWIAPSKKAGKLAESNSAEKTSQPHSTQSLKLNSRLEPASMHQSSASLDRIDTRTSRFRNFGHAIKSTLSKNGMKRNHSFEPISTTALILENRPSNLPSKSQEETQKHQMQYNKILENAKKQEIKAIQKKQKDLEEQQKLEKIVSSTSLQWTNKILPNWSEMQQSVRTRDLWWQGLPSNVRGIVWKAAIGNDLNMTKDLYEIMVARAHQKLKQMAERSTSEENISDSNVSSADRENSVDLIRLDISRTFPSLCVFQKGAPYHGLMQDILGAYACYRPDVGYVQGMSYMAAMLLLNMDPSDAFVAFANLLNQPCQIAFYRLDEKQIKTYFITFEVFFEKNLPKLFSRFKQLQLTPDMYLIDWIFTIFSKGLDLDVASRIWDLFCRDGEEFLFRTAIAILEFHQDALLRMDFIHSAQFLTKLPSSFTHQELFKHISQVTMLSRQNRRWKEVFALIRDMQ